MIWQLASYYHTSALYKNLFNGIQTLGQEQLVVSPRGLNLSADDVQITFPFHNCDSVWSPTDRFLFNRKLNRYLNLLELIKNGPDRCPTLLHAHSLYSDGVAAYKFFKNNQIPYIVAVRSTDLYIFAKYFPHLRPVSYTHLTLPTKRIV